MTLPKRNLVVFAGSFDPFTLGHLDIVETALLLFDRVLISIGSSGSKTPLFTAGERMAMIQEIFKDEPRIAVKSFQGLVVSFAQTEKAAALVRGLRTEADFSYEMPMAIANRLLEPELPTIFLPTSSAYSYVSSSLVREVAMHGGDVSSFVPAIVLQRLKQKVSA